MNVVILEGVISKDAVIKENALYCTIAYNKSYKDKDGNWQKIANFFDFQIRGNYVDAVKGKILKGKLISFRGELVQYSKKDEEKNVTFNNVYVHVDEIFSIKDLPVAKEVETAG